MSESSYYNATAEMSELELARLENIRRNEQFLSELGVAEIRSSIETPSAKKKPSKPAKASRSVKAEKAPAVPTRRSTRVTVDRVAAQIKQLQAEGRADEAQQKQTELDAMVAAQSVGVYVPEQQAAEEAQERISSDPLPLNALTNETDETLRLSMARALVHVIEEAIDHSHKHHKQKHAANEPTSAAESKFAAASAEAFRALRNREEDIAKLAPNRMTAVTFHPSTNKVIVAGGDKSGNLGLWDVDFQSDGEHTHEGVYRYRPHVSNIMKIHFPSEDVSKMFSCSYDGTIRRLDLEKNAFTLAFEAPQELGRVYFSDCDFLYNQPEALYVSKSDGDVGLIDLRSSVHRYEWSFEAQSVRLTSVQQHPTQEHLVVTAGTKDGGIAVHDVRKVGKKWTPISYLAQHTKSINAAYVSPDGEYLVSVSQDDTVRTWKSFVNEKSVECKVLRHNNFTGRWLSTFRPSFDPKRAHTMALGSMLQPRRLEIFTVRESDKKTNNFDLELLCNLQDEYLGSVNSRNCFHPHLEMVVGSNSSGKVHLFR